MAPFTAPSLWGLMASLTESVASCFSAYQRLSLDIVARHGVWVLFGLAVQ